MALQHRSRPQFGVQFHPESVLTPVGPQLVANFLALVEAGH
jgi:anthranilate/para-aminobenzoate synthase component II